MEENYKVSVLIPVYNVSNYIEKCARSVFSQTYQNLEIIFVDDCSPDNSISIIRKALNDFPERKDNTRIISHNRNLGLAAARNTAVKNASGLFIFHLDGDDYIEKNAISRLAELQAKTDADIVSAGIFINEDTIDSRFTEPIYKTRDDMLITMLGGMLHHELCGRLIRRSLYTKNNINAVAGQNYGEGFLALSRLTYYADKTAQDPTRLYHYVMSPTSYTHSAVGWEKEKNSLIEGEKNLIEVYRFFADKDKKFKSAIRETLLRQIFLRLIRAVETRDKHFFYSQKRLFSKAAEKEITDIAGKKIAFLLRMPGSYFILKNYLHIGRLLTKMTSLTIFTAILINLSL